MENNKNHQITPPNGRIGFFSLDVVDRDEFKYRIRNPYELTNSSRVNADIYRLRKAKAAHDAVLGKIDASLVKKTLTVTESPRLDNKTLITKLDVVAKTLDPDVSTILAEQVKHAVPVTVRSWLRKGIIPEANSPKIQQSKGVLRYCQAFDRLLIK